MKSHITHAARALLAGSFLIACGSESSVVGGRCRDGTVLEGSTCVPETIDITIIPPTASTSTGPVFGDPPIGSRSSAVQPKHGPYQIKPNTDLTPDHPVYPVDPNKPLVCAAPLVACRGACIPVDSDAASCGACGKICPSNICINGECQGATPGDVVLIGHDFEPAWWGSAQAKVLVNALTIPTTDPIRVLSYEDGASSAAVNQVKALASAGIKGRGVEFTVAADAAALTSATLAKTYDIVLIHEAGPGDAVATGASWADALGTFTVKGGVVVALDRGTSPVPALLSSSGLLQIASHTTLAAGTHLQVMSSADVIGAQVLSPYAGFGASVSFQGVAAPSLDLGWVVRATALDGTLGDPVVVHRIVRDPK